MLNAWSFGNNYSFDLKSKLIFAYLSIHHIYVIYIIKESEKC